MKRIIVNPGEKFGRLTILAEELRGTRRVLLVECECGERRAIAKSKVTSGKATQCASCSKRVGPERRLLTDVYGVYRKSARKRGLEFELSKADLGTLIFKPCFYCGEVGSNARTPTGYTEPVPYNGVDRFDSSKGYYNNNVLTCCRYCNRMKSDMTHEDFFARINRICDKWNKEPVIILASPMGGDVDREQLEKLINGPSKGSLMYRYDMVDD